MVGSLTFSPLHPLVDEFYFSALFDDNEIFPISDEKYAEQLALQEALMSAANSSTSRTAIRSTGMLIPKEEFSMKGKKKLETGQSSRVLPFCVICMDAKPTEEMFGNDNCSHSFCTDCIGKYVATKIQENISMVKCPEPKCGGVLEPQLCRSLVPKEVFERWENALCESMVLGSHKFYCPFKDCSTLLVDDGGVVVTVSECPNCHRLFCAQCNVAWHEGSDCVAFQAMKRKGSEREEKMTMELAEKEKWRRCPGCNFYVEKSEGCMHISCRSALVSFIN